MFESTSQDLKKQVLGLLFNRYGISCFAILTFQQAIEATSTLWLVFVMQSIASGEPFFTYLFLYLSTLILPYIPGCVAFVMRIYWKQEALRSFINAFIASNRNNINDWNNQSLKEEKLSILTGEAPTAINALIDYLYDLYGYVTSVFFNIIALSVVVEPLFAVAYGISISAVLIIMKMKKRQQRHLTKKALTARIDLVQSLLAAWDNVLIGNEYNFKLWVDKKTQRLNRCLQRNIALERFDQIMAILVSVMTSLPSLLVVIYFAWENRNDPVRLSAFIVTLPMLFLILSYSYQTLSLAFRWGMHKSKLIALFKAILPAPNLPENMSRKVKWDKIKLSEETVAPSNHVSLAFSEHELISRAEKSGRVTLRGENGSGKSTLLMLLKASLNKNAFFLPTHSHLSFSGGTVKLSTGEALKHRLLEIFDKVDASTLLLDEWDANLDQENREDLSQLIDQIALKKCVIEVRHR